MHLLTSGAGDHAGAAARSVKKISPVFCMKGEITPRIPKDAADEFFRRIQIYDPTQLMEKIRENVGYDLQDLDKKSGRMVPGQLSFRLLEDSLDAIAITFGGMTRASGNLAITHPYGTGLIGASFGEPAVWINVNVLHDVGEALRDGKIESFRIRMPDNSIGTAGSTQELYALLEKKYPAEVVENIRRMENTHVAELLDIGYKVKYLGEVQKDIISSLAKAADGIWNLKELDIDAQKKIRKIVFTNSWQVPHWQKVSWIVSELLLMSIGVNEEKAGMPGLEQLRRTLPDREISKFEQGFVFVPKRDFTKEVLDSLPRSGSPTVIVYGSGPYEIEIPMVQEIAAMELLDRALGKRAKNVSAATSLLPENLRRTVILSFEGPSREEVENAMPNLVREYDIYLRQNEGEAGLGELDREKWAKDARELRELAKKTPIVLHMK